MDTLKKAYKVTIPVSTVLHSFELYRAYDEEGAAKLLAKVKGLDLVIARKIIKNYYEDARKSNYSFSEMASKVSAKTFEFILDNIDDKSVIQAKKEL